MYGYSCGQLSMLLCVRVYGKVSSLLLCLLRHGIFLDLKLTTLPEGSPMTAPGERRLQEVAVPAQVFLCVWVPCPCESRTLSTEPSFQPQIPRSLFSIYFRWTSSVPRFIQRVQNNLKILGGTCWVQRYKRLLSSWGLGLALAFILKTAFWNVPSYPALAITL